MAGNGSQAGGRANLPPKSLPHDRSASPALLLPPNWTTVLSQSKKQVYYFNTLTSESTWDHPGSTQETPGSSRARQDKDEWTQVFSVSKQQYYFFNTVTGECMWERPVKAAPAEAQKADGRSGNEDAHASKRPATPRARTERPMTPRSFAPADMQDGTTSGSSRPAVGKHVAHSNQPVDITLVLGLNFSVVGRGEQQRAIWFVIPHVFAVHICT